MSLQKNALLSLAVFATAATAVFTNGFALEPPDPRPQTDLTISFVLLPDRTTPGGEFGSQTRVMIYNQGTTTIEGGFTVEMIISSDRKAPIQVARPTSTFIEDGLLPNGRVVMPTIAPEGTYTFTIPGMTMVTDAPLNDFIFVCAIVDPENVVNEEWKKYPDGYGVNKLCMPIHIVPGSGGITPPPPPAEEPTEPVPPANNINNPASYDKNSDCLLSDSEFFVAIDHWIGEQIENRLYFALVDAWIAQSPICTLASSASGITLIKINQGLLFSNVNKSPLGQLSIYDANGRRVYSSQGHGSHAFWNLRDDRGARVANGIYFAHLGTTGEVKKLIVIN